MKTTYYKPGEWNVDCPVCGFRYKSGQMKKRWDGLMVCEKDWELRHPQELLRTRAEKQSVPYTYASDDSLSQAPNYTFTPDPPPPGTFGNYL